MAPGKQKQKRMSAKVVQDEDYQLRYERVAGIDVAKDDAMVCLRLPPETGTGRRYAQTWKVPARVPDIEALAAELTAAGVQMISMESTSDYWRIWFLVLEKAGLRVQLVNSSQARNLPGRPKTDAADAAWIARLTEMGMLRSSLVPPAEIRALRVYTREITRLAGDRARYWNRMEKLLEDALCKLSAVISGLAASVSGRAMIEALIAGERDPRALAGLARTSMRGKHDDLVKAFTGMRFGDEHAFAAAGYLEVIDMLTAKIAAARERAAAHLAGIEASWGADADGSTGPAAGRGEDAAVLPAAQRLAEIPGLSEDTAIALIAEIGLDMTRFPAPQALVSRAGLAPVPAQSGSRARRAKKGQGNSYARRAATSAGNGAANTATFLGERHRRIRGRPGGSWKKASCAVGRSVLIIVWHLLKDPAARYRDLGPGHYAQHADTSRKTRGHIRQLEALGYDVVLTPREAA
jgi:transposase